MNEPIADAVRSILDGHIVLTRELAHAGHYPAIDVLQSVSRLTSEVLTPEMQTAGQRVRALMAAYKDKKDLIAIGAYEHGSDPMTDVAIALRDPIDGFLRQHAAEPSNANTADAGLLGLAQSAPAPPAAAPVGLPEVAPNAGYTPPPGAAPSPSAIPPLNL
jgi:flagellum-specific ATP synthase